MRHIIAHKSGIHRVACFALYRSLLRQLAFKAPKPLQQHGAALIRERFKKNAKLQSHKKIVEELKEGYDALATLRSLPPVSNSLPPPPPASIVSTISANVSTPLTSIPALLLLLQYHTPSNSLHLPPRYPHKVKPKPPPPPPTRFPSALPLLTSRPLPSSALSGKRHIPNMVTAGGIPFLRIKKPQPPFLSKIIRDKIVTRQKRTDTVARLEQEMRWVVEEDKWDKLIEEEMTDANIEGEENMEKQEEAEGDERQEGQGLVRRVGTEEREPNWAQAVQDSIRVVEEYRRKATRDSQEKARRMWGIVVRERELARIEKKEIERLARENKTEEDGVYKKRVE